MKFYSNLTGGFYDSKIHEGTIPNDAIEITESVYLSLLEGQANGKIIVSGAGGIPALANPPDPSADEIAKAVQAARSSAYRNEADPIFFKSQRGEATSQEWLTKIAEIKTRYPDGVMPWA